MAAAVTTTPQLRAGTGQWVSSLRWDLFWMFSALWASAVLFVSAAGAGNARVGPVMFAIGALLSVTHSWSTTYAVIASPLLREARRRNRAKFVVAPLALAAGSLALGYAVGATDSLPHPGTPLTGEQALWGLYLGLFWVGHFWHFGNQDFGVLSIYRAKAGQTSVRERKVDKAYAVAMMFAIQPCVYFTAVTRSPLSELFYSFVPVSHELVSIAGAWAAAAAVGLTVAVVGYELRKSHPSLPKLFYYLVMLSHPLVLYFVQWQLAFYYYVVYLCSHWLIAVGLVGRIHTNYRRAAGATPVRALLYYAVRLGPFVVLAWLFDQFFGSFNVFSGGMYKEAVAVLPEMRGVLGLILGAFLAEQLLHYYCDRCLFRFRDPDVRRAVAPLL